MARILIACGGTGGHFYPGLAVGLELRKAGHEVLFLLRKDDPAGKRLDALSLPFAEADLRGLPRSLSANWPGWALRMLRGFRTVRGVVRSYRPDAVMGTGAYLTLPAALYARLAGRPCLVHESNAKLGLANRLSVRLGAGLALGLPVAGTDATVTGTPIRPEFAELPTASQARKGLGLAPDKPTILIFGGSQGAAGVNHLALTALKILKNRHGDGFQALWLAGRAHAKRTSAQARGLPVKVMAYLEEMERGYAAADIAVSRSGAGTVAELIAAKKPAVLIPLPHSAADHQTANAELLARAGAAVVAPENSTSGEGLAKILEPAILRETDKLGSMAGGYASMPDPISAAFRLKELVERSVQGDTRDA